MAYRHMNEDEIEALITACDRPRDPDGWSNNGFEASVATPGWFNIEVWFPTFDDFKVGEKGFREDGYTVEMVDEIDDCTNATFAMVSKPAGSASYSELCKQACALAEELNGDADNGWISGSEPYRPELN
jgi:hypothetical protein